MNDLDEHNPQRNHTEPLEDVGFVPQHEHSSNEEATNKQTRTDLLAIVDEKEQRKLRARQRRNGSIWFGLGTFGMIGWSVAVPVLLGIASGLWLDRRWPTTFSWTLTMLFLGFTLGCLNAWYWVTRERRQIEQLVNDRNGRFQDENETDL